jgi:hypothetical protein
MRLASLLSVAALFLSTSLLAAPPQMTADEQGAFQFVKDNTQPGETFELHLGSPQQFAFVKAMLQRARATKLLAAAEAARGSASSAPPAAVSGAAGQAASLNAVEYLAVDTTMAKCALISSVPGGTSSSSMSVSLLANGIIFASSPQYQEVEGGKHFVETFSATIPRGMRRVPVTASALFIDTFGGMPHFYTMMVTAGPGIARTQCVTGPNYGKKQSGTIPCPSRWAKCTKPEKKSIVVCLGKSRGSCNYVDQGGTMFPFTIAGTITFPSPVDPALAGMYMLDLQSRDGACPLAAGGAFAAPLSAEFFSVDPKNRRRLRYCIPNNSLPPSSCIKSGASLYFALTVYAQMSLPDGRKATGTAVVSSDPKVTANASFVTKMPSISVQH